MNQNEIIRIQKKRNNFVMMDKGFLNDNRLSFKAKGILAYLLSKPDGWKVIVKDLVNHAKDGRDSIYSGLKELKKYGYFSKVPVRNGKGIVTHWESTVFEDPTEKPINMGPYPLPDFPYTENPYTENPYTENPYTENPYTENPYTENPEHSNNNISNISNTNNISNITNSNITNKEVNNNDYTNIISYPIISDQIMSSDMGKNVRECLSEKGKTDMIRSDEIHTEKLEDILKRKNSNPAIDVDEGWAIKKESPRNATPQQVTHSKKLSKKHKYKYNYTETLEFIKCQIEYNILSEKKYIDKAMLDEVVEVITTTVCSEFADGYIQMKDQFVPVDMVRSAFLKLNMFDIEYFFDCFNKQAVPIAKPAAYIRKSLYENKYTINHHYANRVKTDMLKPLRD